MIVAYVTYFHNSVRDAYGRDGDAAAAAVGRAANRAAIAVAQRTGAVLEWDAPPRHEARDRAFLVRVLAEPGDPYCDERSLAEELEDAMGRASSQAVEDGGWG